MLKKTLAFYLLGICLYSNGFAESADIVSAVSNEAKSSDYKKNIDLSNIKPENFSYTPQLYLAGYTGNDLLTRMDMLMPLYISKSSAFFGYLQSRFSPAESSISKNDWSGSGGLGIRNIVQDNFILGAYIFGDYNQAASGNFYYWDINPGIEALGKIWDFRVNGYIPVGNKNLITENWATELDIYDYVRFEEGTHLKYDHRLAYHEEAGIGGDIEIGRKLFKINNILFKGYINCYYYNFEYNNNILGGGARITMQPSKYITFSINDSYDNYLHNTFMLGMQIRINELFNEKGTNNVIDENNLRARLLDPIERNFSSLSTGNDVPTASGKYADLGEGIERDHIIFFSDLNSGYISPNHSDLIKGSYGNPYSSDEVQILGMQKILDDSNVSFPDYAYFYFPSGNYLIGVNSALHSNQFIMGRSSDYVSPASASGSVPTLYGSFYLYNYDNFLKNYTFDSIKLLNSPQFVQLEGEDITALYILYSRDVYINNSVIGNNTSDQSYNVGMKIEASNGVEINGTQVNAYCFSGEGNYCYNDYAYAYGIETIGSEVILGKNNNISSISNLGAIGIYSVLGTYLNSNVNIGSNNTIQAMSRFGTYNKQAIAYSLYLVGTNMNIDHDNKIISESYVENNYMVAKSELDVLYGSSLTIGNNNLITNTSYSSAIDHFPYVINDAEAGVVINASSMTIGNNNRIKNLALANEVFGDTDFGTIKKNAYSYINLTQGGILNIGNANLIENIAQTEIELSGISCNATTSMYSGIYAFDASTINIGSNNIINNITTSDATVNSENSELTSMMYSNINLQNNSILNIADGNTISNINIDARNIENIGFFSDNEYAEIIIDSGSLINIGTNNTFNALNENNVVFGYFNNVNLNQRSSSFISYESIININGGNNIFNSTSHVRYPKENMLVSSESYGIYLNNSQLVFNYVDIDKNNIFEINSDNYAWGIVLSDATSYIGDVNELLKYNDFYKNGISTDGFKIYWEDGSNPSVPW